MENIMPLVKNFIHKRPALAFYTLTFVISWGGMLIATGFISPQANEEQAAMLLVFSYIAMLVGPSLVGILLTGVIDRKVGFRQLVSRLLKWQVGVRWYIIALLVAPLLIMLTLHALSLISSEYLPRLYTESDKGFLLQFSIIAGLLVGCFEELGWTGFLLPRVRLHYGPVKTGLIIGFIYAAWNFPVVFWVSKATGTAGSLPMAIFMPAVLFTWLPTYRVLMVWVYDHTESLLLAMLMHASLIAFWRIFTPLTLTGSALIISYIVFTTAMWVIIIAVMRRQTQRQPMQGDLPVGISNQK
jgi:membrane protease YdiL (CAAX protease family)